MYVYDRSNHIVPPSIARLTYIRSTSSAWNQSVTRHTIYNNIRIGIVLTPDLVIILLSGVLLSLLCYFISLVQSIIVIIQLDYNNNNTETPVNVRVYSKPLIQVHLIPINYYVDLYLYYAG